MKTLFSLLGLYLGFVIDGFATAVSGVFVGLPGGARVQTSVAGRRQLSGPGPAESAGSTRCMKRAAVVLPMLLWSMPSQAASPTDYAWGMPLQVDSVRPVYRLSLPAAVYHGSTRDDLSDIQVFNSAGEAVPVAIRLPQPATQEQTRLDVLFYPLAYQTVEEPPAGDARIRIDRDGAVQTVINPAAPGTAGQEHVYIIDLRALDAPVRRLEFEVGAEAAKFVQPFALDTGSDLNRWRPLVEHAALTRLQHQGQSLDRLYVDLPVQPAEFVRLRWLAPPGLELSNVAAVVTSEAALRTEDERHWTQVKPLPGTGARQTYVYDLGAALPVDQFNLVLPGNNLLARARFESRPAPDADWKPDVETRVYRLQVDGLQLANRNILVAHRPRRQVRVALENAGELNAAPELKAGWIAHDLLFLARGEGPFLLAYGRALKQPPLDRARLLSEELPAAPDMIGRALAGERRILGGEARLQPKAPINWRVLSLWTLLLLAVIALAWMVRQLVREMRPHERPPTDAGD